MPSGISISVKPESEKLLEPRTVKDAGRTIVLSAVQPLKEPLPIDATVSGKSTEASVVQPEKAYSPMLETP